MKKTIQTIVILFTVLCLAGCKIKNIEEKPQQPNNADNNTTSTVSTDASVKQKETTALQDYYKTLGEDYGCKKGSEFYGYYQASDYLEAYPIYGTYLDPTGDVAYIFYRDGSPFRIALVTFDSEGNVQGKPICRDMTKRPEIVFAGSAEDYYSLIIQCMERYPDFTILGIARDSTDYPRIYPVGRLMGDTTLKYIAGEPQAFNLVDPFETLEDGYNAFQEYLTEREKLRAQVPIYPWTNAKFYTSYYMRRFEHSDSSLDLQAHPYMGKYDSKIEVPLLDANLNEDIYVLYLLTYHNQLIAEVVIERTYDGTSDTYSAVWENIAEVAADGQFIPMEISQTQYVSILNSASAHKPSFSIQGVVYDNGKLIPVGMCDGKQMAFDFSANTLREYKSKSGA